MSLDRHQQVARVWDWLPAFRAAAEYQSLQRAGLALAISPSALSRTIKLLEDALELTLFTRSPTGLALTADGERLLVATRDAMRRIYEGMADVAPQRLRAATVGPGLPRLLCDAVLDVLPGWSVGLSEVLAADIAERLRCGDLDLVLSHEPVPGAGVRHDELPGLQLQLALGPGGDRGRVVCLENAAYARAGASITAANLDQLLTLAKRLGSAVFAPAYAVPSSWEVLVHGPSLPVFLVTRDYVGSPPPFVDQLRRTLVERLSGRANAAGYAVNLQEPFGRVGA